MTMETRLQTHYREKVRDDLKKSFGYANPMQIPKLLKIVVNVGVGREGKDAKALENAQKELTQITGQKPVITRARTSISGFNVRQGDICGICVTLRRERMFEFLDRLITVALPRVRDFNGLPANATDGRGSYTMGVREQVIFPEIDYNAIQKVRGFSVTFVTNARTPKETVGLLKAMGLPIREA